MKKDVFELCLTIVLVIFMVCIVSYEWGKKKNFGWFQDQNRYIKIEQEQFDRLINVLEKIADEKGEQKNG